MTTTPNRAFTQTAYGATGWDTAVNAVIGAVDNAVFVAGSYNAQTTYKVGDMVLHSNGTMYLAIQAGIGHDPASAPTFWQAFTVTPALIGAVSTSDSRLSDARTPLAHHASHAPGNSDALDYTLVNLVGLASAMPTAASANAGQTYFQTDTAKFFRSNGSTWVQVAASTAHAATHITGGSDAIQTATDSQPGLLSASDHSQLTANTTKLAGLPASVTGTSPISVSGGAVSIQNATDAQPGAMTAADHSQLTTNTANIATNTSNIAALITYGTLASRPASTNDKALYFATDSSGGTLYQYETGTGWVQATKGITAAPVAHAASHAPGASDKLDYTLVHLAGLASAMPTAATANAGLFYFQTDTGKLYRSDGSAWSVVSLSPVDFGNDYIDSLAADGADMSIRCARNMTVLSGDVGFDANPAQTMTITLQQRRSGSVIASATLTVSTSGTITPSGFPISNVLAGDRMRVNLSGTANVTGLNYVFKARAES